LETDAVSFGNRREREAGTTLCNVDKKDVFLQIRRA